MKNESIIETLIITLNGGQIVSKNGIDNSVQLKVAKVSRGESL